MLQVLTAICFALAFGCIFCFFGYRAFLVLLPVWGFFAGFWLGAYGTVAILGGGFLGTVTGWSVGILLALVGALFSYLLYPFGAALVAGGFGAALLTGLLRGLGLDSGLLLTLLGLVAGVAVALATLGMNLHRYVIMAITAVGGANGLIVAAALLFGRVSLPTLQAEGNGVRPLLQDSLLWAVVWLALALIGFMFQVRADRYYEFRREYYIQAWG